MNKRQQLTDLITELKLNTSDDSELIYGVLADLVVKVDTIMELVHDIKNDPDVQ
jgi:hypothetical protein